MKKVNILDIGFCCISFIHNCLSWLHFFFNFLSVFPVCPDWISKQILHLWTYLHSHSSVKIDRGGFSCFYTIANLFILTYHRRFYWNFLTRLYWRKCLIFPVYSFNNFLSTLSFMQCGYSKIWVIVFNTTFNNISVVKYVPVLMFNKNAIT